MGFLIVCLGIFALAGGGAYLVTSTDIKGRYDALLQELVEQEAQGKAKKEVVDMGEKSATIK